MTEGQKTQTQIGVALWVISIVMFLIAFQVQNAGLLFASIPTWFIGFVNTIRPWILNRQRRQILEREYYEDVAAIQRQRRRKQLAMELEEEEGY